MNDKHWKRIAIVFIGLFILETAFFSYALNTSDYDEREIKCLVDTCGYDFVSEDWTKEYNYYNYDIYSKMCSCFSIQLEPYKKVIE